MRVGEDVASSLALVRNDRLQQCLIRICMGKQGRKERTTGVMAVA